MSKYIDGNFFKSLCDIHLGEDVFGYKDTSEDIVLYADTHDYKKALYLISCQPEKNFILVTHNSDHCVEKTDIPQNLNMWYGMNINFEHPKLNALPIGLENEHWHPEKRTVMKMSKQKKPQERIIKALSQFNPATFKEERVSLLVDVVNENIFADPYYCINGENFTSYTDNLNNYAFCLCPRGNGIDTHRVWECIYSGCIPIVKEHITHKFDITTPILTVDNWSLITQNFLQQIYHDFPFHLFIKNPILSQEYWKEKIRNNVQGLKYYK